MTQVRAQFRFYLVHLLRVSVEGEEVPAVHLYSSHYLALLRCLL